MGQPVRLEFRPGAREACGDVLRPDAVAAFGSTVGFLCQRLA